MVVLWVLIALAGAGFFFVLGWSTCSASTKTARQAAIDTLEVARAQAGVADAIAKLAGGLGGMTKILAGVRERSTAAEAKVSEVYNAMHAVGLFERSRGVDRNSGRTPGAPSLTAVREPNLGRRDDDESPDESLLR